MEIFKLFGSVFVDTTKAKQSISDLGTVGNGLAKVLGPEMAGTITSHMKDVAGVISALGPVMEEVGKQAGKALKQVVSEVTDLTSQAVSAYADYEQNIGGVETLFGESASQVVENANNAFKTAGLSANEYMETVTSFSASLLQSLDGDTAKVAEYSDMAITDMADNANKMGTDMSAIQNAYQGFAKQNYTMLDNLNTMGSLAA